LVDHMDRERFETTVISLGLGNEIKDRFMQLDCRVMTFQRQKRFDFALYKRVENFIRDEKIDIVMTTLFYADVLGATVGKKGGAKGVFSWETISHPKWLVPHRLWSYRWAIRRADKVISVSQATADWLVQERGVAADKVMIIPYGVNVDKFNAEPKTISRTELGVPEDAFIIGQVSRLNEQKGHVYLIDAAPQIVEKIPNVKFVLAGDGPSRGIIEEKIAAHNLQDYFILLGARRDVPEIIRQFDIFTLPSLYEGLPNVILEAMSTSLPIVATPADGTKEAIVDGESGILVPMQNPQALAEQLIRTAQDAALRKRLGTAARKRAVDVFSLQGQVNKFQDLYTEYAKM